MVESGIYTKPIAGNTILSVPSPCVSVELSPVDLIQSLGEHSARIRRCITYVEFFAMLDRGVKSVQELRAE